MEISSGDIRTRSSLIPAPVRMASCVYRVADCSESAVLVRLLKKERKKREKKKRRREKRQFPKLCCSARSLLRTNKILINRLIFRRLKITLTALHCKIRIVRETREIVTHDGKLFPDRFHLMQLADSCLQKWPFSNF